MKHWGNTKGALYKSSHIHHPVCVAKYSLYSSCPYCPALAPSTLHSGQIPPLEDMMKVGQDYIPIGFIQYKFWPTVNCLERLGCFWLKLHSQVQVFLTFNVSPLTCATSWHSCSVCSPLDAGCKRPKKKVIYEAHLSSSSLEASPPT